MPYKWLKRSRRKLTGGLLRKFASKKQRDMGNYPAETSIGSRRLKIIRTRGGNHKYRLLRAEHANVLDKSAGETKRVKILDVVENRANREYARRRIITKGCVIETEMGNARVTSRPGQHGVINAVVLESE